MTCAQPGSLVSDAAAAVLRDRDPDCLNRVRDLESRTLGGSLDRTIALLVQIAVHASVTGLAERELRRFVSQALDAGVSGEEILAVLKLCTILGIHGAAQASPILAESLSRRGCEIRPAPGDAPVIAAMHEAGSFNSAWDALEQWDPVWLDRLLAVGLDQSIIDVLGRKNFELLCIALDASVTHLYNPGTSRHIEAALDIGVSPGEILDVIKLVSIQGLRSLDAGIAILQTEFDSYSSTFR